MTQEEKARRYDEALEKAKSWHQDSQIDFRISLETLFPELKESEDERIRKSLIDYFNRFKSSDMWNEAFSFGDVVSWIEKQGEQKPFDYENATIQQKDFAPKVKPKFKVGDNIKTTNEEPLTITKIDDKGYWSEDLFICGFDDAAKWKLVEQKYTDKIEPKFKVGDTVTVKPMSCHGKVFKGEPFKIVDIIEDKYVSDDGKTYSISLQDGWKLVNQKPAWSEEDKNTIKDIIEDLEYAQRKGYVLKNNTFLREINWLKSLKQRIGE